MINNTISFLILRVAIGATMFGHGLVRLPKLDKFSGWMVKSFENSMLPASLVKPFSYALPIAEFLIGLLLIIGLFTRQSLVAGSIVMIMLILGTTLIENWEALVSQLIHAAFFALLLSYITYNSYAVDNLFKK
ncbi:DoxX family membrane protein [Chitinophaga ginsengisoli]|uniref:Thiosulfate dehydrogenase [quinone] large subunit n=1 Tax=Chitinophaga ginsengisoli TaxID=363837 RepID=A0A2P8G0W2_9BACT|nr:DoxX family membrane protein [Chitinophaga ginsengisoli]PSL27604.1 thiosulfate dehydrogenase [quinone] large subunit [Chitinophaga ginsengisoli]